jgi:SHS2 domain-containing protein
MAPSGYEELPHTADWAVRVKSVTLGGLFEQAAIGMQAMMGITTFGERATTREFTASGDDVETLLIKFLEEILFLLEVENCHVSGITFEDIHETHLRAHLDCQPLRSIEKEIKAVTFHQLEIRRLPSGYETVIVFDV